MTLAEEIRYWLDSINESGFDDAMDELDREVDNLNAENKQGYLLELARAFKAAKYPEMEKYSDEALAKNEKFISIVRNLGERSGQDPLIVLKNWAERNPAYQKKVQQDELDAKKDPPGWDEDYFNFMTKLMNKEKQGVKPLPGDTATDDRLRIYTYRRKKYKGRNQAYNAVNNYVKDNARSLYQQSKGKL